MKKILFLAVFLFAGFVILSAQGQEVQGPTEEPGKIFNIGDGGIVKVMPQGGQLNVRIAYDKPSDAPALAQVFLGDYKISGKDRSSRSKFSVKIFDGNGFMLCKQMIPFSNFSLNTAGQHPRAILEFQTGGCGINSYDKVASVAVDYNSN